MWSLRHGPGSWIRPTVKGTDLGSDRRQADIRVVIMIMSSGRGWPCHGVIHLMVDDLMGIWWWWWMYVFGPRLLKKEEGSRLCQEERMTGMNE